MFPGSLQPLACSLVLRSFLALSVFFSGSDFSGPPQPLPCSQVLGYLSPQHVLKSSVLRFPFLDSLGPQHVLSLSLGFSMFSGSWFSGSLSPKHVLRFLVTPQVPALFLTLGIHTYCFADFPHYVSFGLSLLGLTLLEGPRVCEEKNQQEKFACGKPKTGL